MEGMALSDYRSYPSTSLHPPFPLFYFVDPMKLSGRQRLETCMPSSGKNGFYKIFLGLGMDLAL